MLPETTSFPCWAPCTWHVCVCGWPDIQALPCQPLFKRLFQSHKFVSTETLEEIMAAVDKVLPEFSGLHASLREVRMSCCRGVGVPQP